MKPRIALYIVLIAMMVLVMSGCYRVTPEMVKSVTSACLDVGGSVHTSRDRIVCYGLPDKRSSWGDR